VFPGAKTIHDSKSSSAVAAGSGGQLSPAQAAVQAACLPKVAAAQTVVDAICHKQVWAYPVACRRVA
jgi:hypothetical protein